MLCPHEFYMNQTSISDPWARDVEFIMCAKWITQTATFM